MSDLASQLNIAELNEILNEEDIKNPIVEEMEIDENDWGLLEGESAPSVTIVPEDYGLLDEGVKNVLVESKKSDHIYGLPQADHRFSKKPKETPKPKNPFKRNKTRREEKRAEIQNSRVVVSQDQAPAPAVPEDVGKSHSQPEIVHDPEVASLPASVFCILGKEKKSRISKFKTRKLVGKPKPVVSDAIKRARTASRRVQAKFNYANSRGKTFHAGMCANEVEKTAFYRLKSRRSDNECRRKQIALDHYNISDKMVDEANRLYWEKRNKTNNHPLGPPKEKPSFMKSTK